MIFSLLGGLSKLSSGLGGLGKSLLTGTGKIFNGGINNRLISSLGGIAGSLSQYSGQIRELNNSEIFQNLQSQYGIGSMARQATNVVDNSIKQYGKMLQYGQRSGNGFGDYSELWNMVSRSVKDYRNDRRTMEYNRAQRDATYAAARSAAKLSTVPGAVGKVFDIINILKDSKKMTAPGKTKHSRKGGNG